MKRCIPVAAYCMVGSILRNVNQFWIVHEFFDDIQLEIYDRKAEDSVGIINLKLALEEITIQFFLNVVNVDKLIEFLKQVKEQI